MAKILILYHSRLGSVEQLTHLIARGVNAIEIQALPMQAWMT